MLKFTNKNKKKGCLESANRNNLQQIQASHSPFRCFESEVSPQMWSPLNPKTLFNYTELASQKND
jgi:hypothetical protein